jgi:DNA-binding NtrC family response regulator
MRPAPQGRPLYWNCRDSMRDSLPPVLVVDDEKNMRLSLETVMGDEGYKVRSVESAEEALGLLDREDFFMVITDARLGGMSGYEFLPKVRARWPDLPILMITAYATPKLAVEAIKAGAMDYLGKPFAPEELLHAVGRCGERYRLLRENAALRAQAGEPFGPEHIVGESPGMREIRQLVQTIAPTDARVLILGESGTGKELVAGAIHSLSQRASEGYVRINCAAIPEALLESELFGHEKGAFTGALKQKRGRVEEANKGTVFLDEIADMSRPLQAKLLRFLEDGTFTRVGGTQELKVDLRIIAATNRDILAAITQDQFREDLYHRLNVVQLRLPPLRQRGDDVLLLAEHFLKTFGFALNKPARTFSKAAKRKLLSHHWPGNVRELRNVVERALILETATEIGPAGLPDFEIEGRLYKPDTAAPKIDSGDSIEKIMTDFEKHLIVSILEQNHFSINKTADQLHISRHALRYRMQRLNIEVAEIDDDSTTVTSKGQTP